MKLDLTLIFALISYGLAYSTLVAFNFTNVSNKVRSLLSLLPNRNIIGFSLFLYCLLTWILGLSLYENDLKLNIYNSILCLFLIKPFQTKKSNEQLAPEFDGISITLVGLGFLLSYISDLFALMIIIEIISLYLYTIAAINHDAGTSASAKYFIYGSFMAAIGYTGLVLIYQSAQSFSVTTVALASEFSTLPFIGFSLFLSYLFFKLGIFPFQTWVPLVYSQITNNTLYIFAVVSKLFFGQLLITLLTKFSSNVLVLNYIQNIIIVVVIGNLIYGTLGSLTATKINELIAYSSIIHMGYMLLPFTTVNSNNFTLVLNASFYYLIYYTISTALFLLVCGLSANPIIFLTDLNQAFDFPLYIGLLVSLISMAGLPPTIGFLAKWNVWTQLIFTDQTFVSHLTEELTLSTLFQNTTFFVFLLSLVVNVISIWLYIKVIISPQIIRTKTLKLNTEKIPTIIITFLILFITFGTIFLPIC